MRRGTSEAPAARRAHWLAELSEALSQAQRIAWLVGASGNSEAMELYGRIEEALTEVQALRFGGFDSRHNPVGSQWLGLIEWTPRVLARRD